MVVKKGNVVWLGSMARRKVASEDTEGKSFDDITRRLECARENSQSFAYRVKISRWETISAAQIQKTPLPEIARDALLKLCTFWLSVDTSHSKFFAHIKK